MDIFPLSIDAISVLALFVAIVISFKAVRSFQQSRQAVIESASLLTVIVDALTSRIQRSESALTTLRLDMATAARRGDTLERDQRQLNIAHEQTMRQLLDLLSNDKKFVMDLEQLKKRINQMLEEGQTPQGLPKRENFATALSEGEILSALTLTERFTLEILRVEGSKGAPELGKRLKKSREHTSRLMKKLYMEGFVSRESNHTPFKYKLNEKVRSALESTTAQLTEERLATP